MSSTEKRPSTTTPGGLFGGDPVPESKQKGGFLRPGLPFTRCRHCDRFVSLRSDGRMFRHEGVPASRERGTCRGSGVQVRNAPRAEQGSSHA